MLALVLLPTLGRHGLWDPHEIQIADAARKLAAGDAGAAVPNAAAPAVTRTQPPLTPWLLSASLKLLGISEFAVRLPLALLGLLAAMATYFIGASLGRPRAGKIDHPVRGERFGRLTGDLSSRADAPERRKSGKQARAIGHALTSPPEGLDSPAVRERAGGWRGTELAAGAPGATSRTGQANRCSLRKIQASPVLGT